jgi:beta-glucanase (GH16 family)
VEAYGHEPFAYMAAIHNWRRAGQGQPEDCSRNRVGQPVGADLTTGFQDYGVLVTDKEVVWYFDNAEIFRRTLYRAEDPALGKFYMLLDFAISQDWPVKSRIAATLTCWLIA